MATGGKPIRPLADASAKFAPVDKDCVYALELFKAITGLKTTAIRQARRAGLKILIVGRRRFVRGSDFLEYLDRLADQPGNGS